MPTILLVRHGQASFGAADYDALSDTGITQAALVADDLAGRGLEVATIVSGTLARQRDTAAPAAARFGLEVAEDPRWNEYSMDEIVGRHSRSSARTQGLAPDQPVTSAQFQEALDEALAAWIVAGERSQAAESWPAFSGRARDALTELAATLPSGSTGLVFTSGGVIAALAAALLELPAESLLRFNRVAVNGAITKVITGRRGATLVSFNEHGFLDHAGRKLVTYR